MSCTHTDMVKILEPPAEIDGCEECIAAGDRNWLHLRMCHTCGHIGCCDSSPGKHASAHWRETEHPVMRSVQPGEDWSWCFADEQALKFVSS